MSVGTKANVRTVVDILKIVNVRLRLIPLRTGSMIIIDKLQSARGFVITIHVEEARYSPVSL